MNWEEMEKTWADQRAAAWPAERLAALEQEFTAKQRKLGRTLFWRDVREAAVGIFAAAVIARTGWQMGAQGWPVVIAVVLLLGLSGFFIRERIRVRRAQPAADVPLLARLDAEIAEQRRQHRLLSRVATWYLAPILAAGAVFGATVLVNAPLPLAARLAVGALMVAILAGCGAGTLWLNRRVVRLAIEPQLRELESWRKNLTPAE
ncbi:MAG TPA: hypothetical protein VEQ65_12680 [Opitutus sp.]|nr:hypothetical protein [Opitutus sp.]